MPGPAFQFRGGPRLERYTHPGRTPFVESASARLGLADTETNHQPVGKIPPRLKDVEHFVSQACTPEFAGKIVACERGGNARIEKGYNLSQGGAAGMILYNPSLAGEDFIMLHSTARGEINNPRWEITLYAHAAGTQTEGDNYHDATTMQRNVARNARTYFEDF